MLTDDQFASSIGARLHAEVADIGSPPDLMPTLHRQQRRRMLAIRGGAVASLAATAGVVALVMAGAGPPRVAAGGGTPTPESRIETVAYVTQRTTDALAHADQFVERAETRAVAGTTFVAWTDAATGRELVSSRTPAVLDQVLSLTIRPDGMTTVLVVDNGLRSWWSYDLTRPGLAGGTAMMNPLDPDTIREDITSGGMEVLGHEPVDGRDTLHLRLSARVLQKATVHMELWVDAQSYLPVKTQTDTGTETSATTTFSWLPRTPANLANVELAPPAGYTRLSGPPAGKATVG